MVKGRRLPLYESPLSSLEEVSDDEYVQSDDVCSEDLSDTGSVGEGMFDDMFSSDDEPECPYWDTDPSLRWDVWQIDDFCLIEKTNEKTGVTTSEYYVGVLWDWRATPSSKRFRSMEPLEAMLETHREECWLAMRSKESSYWHFREFCARDWYNQTIIGAAEDYSCMFKAMRVVAAYNVRFVGHAVVLRVADGGKTKTVIDKGEEKPVEECRWMNFFAFVRPFRVW